MKNLLSRLWAALRGASLRTSAPPPATAELLRICHGDDERMRRLIDSEHRRAPGISEAEACRRAVERYRRDNR